MKSKELYKFETGHSLVHITDQTLTPYCICSNYDDNSPEGSKWDWGHYFTTESAAIEYYAKTYLYATDELVEKAKKETKRYQTIAYNAITYGKLDEVLSEDVLLFELGCTEEEYEKIMKD